MSTPPALAHGTAAATEAAGVGDTGAMRPAAPASAAAGPPGGPRGASGPAGALPESTAPAAASDSRRARADAVSVRVRETLDGVFAAVAATREDTAALLAGPAGGGAPAPVVAALAALRPGLHERLGRHALVSGIGFVAAPGLLADVPAWLEWWQRGPDSAVRPLLLDLDPEHSAYSDYTHWDWYALPRETGRRAVAGPYVDYLCSDEYGLTLSEPVHVAGRFVGVAAADVYLRHFEAAVLPVLQELPVPARLVNARGRVAASTDPAHLAGSLTKGPDFAAVLAAAADAGPAAVHRHGDLRLTPCAGTPLVLVTPER
ncbi:cache domain-containing protein [Streptomyces sp. NPDC004267]|uniref:cache domain-containing protein n=1 Tax=Streptomyces sp. NPDC004267 TaxID=3364694 RepID=UPI00369318EE